MRVAILSTCDIEGGAARAAYRLHQGLRGAGHDSVMLVKTKTSADDSVHQLDWRVDRNGKKDFAAFQRNQECIQNARTDLSDTFFSADYPGFDLSDHPVIKSADMVNVHWTGWFQSAASLARLSAAGKKLVFTLHDQRAFTGGCHFSAGCQKFERECQPCPQLQESCHWLPETGLADSHACLGNQSFTLVTPSRWLAACARKSRVFSSSRIEVIPNGIDTSIFKPQSKLQARADLGIAPDPVYLLFGAEFCAEKRKGFRYLREALRLSCQNPEFHHLVQDGKIQLLTFGGQSDHVEEWPGVLKSFGKVEEPQRMAALFSAADAMLIPSIEDNLPNVLLESLCCGTPIVGFDVGGMPDIINSNKTGILVTSADSAALASAIQTLAYNPLLREKMADHCRSGIGQRFSVEVQAESYLKLFQEVIGDDSLAQSSSNCVQASKHKTVRPLQISRLAPRWFSFLWR